MRFAGFPPFPACAENSVYDGNCTGLSICVVEGTTHVDIVRDLHQGRATIITARNIATFYNFFRNGLCQVLAGDQFEIASGQAGFSGEDGYQVGSKAFSKEPLALVTRQGDTEWSDFVEWVLQALFTAEEEQIGQTTASIFPMSEFYRPSMFIDALRAVGNYGEMYERHLEPILPRSGLNRLNEGDSGLIYSLPFGSVETSGPVTGPTLNSIVERGFLNCGVSREDAFTKFENGTYSGFDVDLCKTLSAAIFGGVVQVEYVDLLSSERFSALARGDVDVLSRITTRTYSREVKEPTTGIGFEYSMPYFYDGMSFGGVPP